MHLKNFIEGSCPGTLLAKGGGGGGDWSKCIANQYYLVYYDPSITMIEEHVNNYNVNTISHEKCL